MPNANGMILSKEEESDAEVRREDQDRINEFGRLNARLHEVRDEVNKLKVSERIWMPMSISPFEFHVSHSCYDKLKICNGCRAAKNITYDKNLMEKIEDASTELMMGNGDRVMLRLGEAMFEATEDEATEFCEAEVERHQETIDKMSAEEADIIERQSGLKKILYGRFGKSINLEEK
jgi:prefoldin subunit 4